MLISPSPASQPPRPGDFGATVEGGKLLMPRVVVKHLHAGQIRTAEDLIGFLQVFPTSLARDLGWDLPDVQAAKGLLLEILRAHLRPEFFTEEPPFNAPLGVVPRTRSR